VPEYPGITSALGLLTTDLKYDAVRTAFQVSGALDLARLNADFAAMRAELGQRLQADRVPAEAVRFARSGDLRYVGQGYELRIPFPDFAPGGALDEAAMAGVFRAFAEAHVAEYGHAFPDSAIEVVNLNATATGETAKIAAAAFAGGASLEAATLRLGRSSFARDGATVELETPFLDRRALPLDRDIAGPAVILQTDTTTVVPPGWTARADRRGNLVLKKEGPT
jgi:N-methylhydantoinase A/oxoprolinase/acetone carboxylase beta subunit